MSKTNDAILEQAEEQHQYRFHEHQWYRKLVRKIWHLAGPYSFFKNHPRLATQYNAKTLDKSDRQAIVKKEQMVLHDYDPYKFYLAEAEIISEMATRARERQAEDPNWHAKTLEGKRRKKEQAQAKQTKKTRHRKPAKAPNSPLTTIDNGPTENHPVEPQEAPGRAIPVTIVRTTEEPRTVVDDVPYSNGGPLFMQQHSLRVVGATDPDVIEEQQRRAVRDSIWNNAVEQLSEALETWLDNHELGPSPDLLNHFCGYPEDHTAEKAYAILMGKGYRFGRRNTAMTPGSDLFICLRMPGLTWEEWEKQFATAGRTNDGDMMAWLMKNRPKEPASKEDITNADPWH